MLCPNCHTEQAPQASVCGGCGLQLRPGGGGEKLPPPQTSLRQPKRSDDSPDKSAWYSSRADSSPPKGDADRGEQRESLSRRKSSQSSRQSDTESRASVNRSVVVVREPEVREEPRGCNPLAAFAVIALILVLLPAMISAAEAVAISFLLPIIIVIVVLALLGFGGIMRGFGSAATGCLTPMMFMPGRRGERGRRLAMTFSTAAQNDRGGRTTLVRLVGHGDGVYPGDRVRVRGVRMMGRVEALVVTNESNGRVLFRSGLVLSSLSLLLLAFCLITLLVRFAGD